MCYPVCRIWNEGYDVGSGVSDPVCYPVCHMECRIRRAICNARPDVLSGVSDMMCRSDVLSGVIDMACRYGVLSDGGIFRTQNGTFWVSNIYFGWYNTLR